MGVDLHLRPHHSHLHRHVRVALPLRTPPTRQKQVYLNVTTPPPNHKPKPTPTSHPSSSPCSSGSPPTDSTHSAETGIPQCHHTSPQPQTQPQPHITAIFIAMFEWLSPYGLHPLGRNRYTSMSPHLPPTTNPTPTPHHSHLHRHVRVALPLRTPPTRQKQVYLNVTTPPPNHKPNPNPTSQPSSSPCSSGSPPTDSTHSAETGIPQCHHTSPQPQTQTHPHITAIFIAMFEWLSPYGLHPLGRNRYTSMSPHLPPTTNPTPTPHHSHLHRHVRVALPLRTPPTRQKQVYLNVTTPPPNHKPNPNPTSQPSSSPCSSGSPPTDSTHSAETSIPQCHHTSPQPQTQTHPHITAIFIAMFEWFSPYGLHPLGRNRYTSMSPHLPPTTNPTPTPHHSHLHRHVRVALPLRTPPTRQKQVYFNVTTPPPNHKPNPNPTSQPSSSPCSSGSPPTDSTHSAETGIAQCHHTSPQPQTQTHPHITAIFIAMFEWLSPYGLHPLGRNRYTSMSPHLPPTTNPNPSPHHSHLHHHVRVALPLRTPPTRQKQVYLNVTTPPPNHKPNPNPTSQPSSSPCSSGSPPTDSTHSAETGIPQCHHTSPQPQTQTHPHITAIFIAMFEWLSPYGLHPLGRNRYTSMSPHLPPTTNPTQPHITAIFIAMFEWLSPYGLHPLGRNRYTSMSPHLPPTTNPNPPPHHSHLHRHVRVALPLRTPPTRQKQVYLNVTTPPPNHKPKPTPTSQPSSSPCSSGSPLTDSTHSAETGIPQCHHASPQPQTQPQPHITAIFIAMFEWLSPYGLHPLGRNRYTSMSPHLPPTTNPNPPPHHSHLHRHVRVALPLRTPPTRQKQVYLNVTTPPPNHKPNPNPTSQPSSSPCSSGSPPTDSTHSAETGIPQCHHTSPQPQTQTHPHITAIFIAMFEWLSPYGLHPLGRNRYTSMSPHLPPTINPTPTPHHSHLHRHVRVALPLRTPPTRQKQVYLNVTTPPPTTNPTPTPHHSHLHRHVRVALPLRTPPTRQKQVYLNVTTPPPNHKPKPTPTSQPSSSPCSSGSPLTDFTHSAETGIPQCHHNSPQPQTQTHPHITAIFIAMFEWLSPYGLHPLGRNRYTSMSPHLPPTTNPTPTPHHSHLHRHVRVALPLRTPPTRQKQVYLNVTTPPPTTNPNPPPHHSHLHRHVRVALPLRTPPTRQKQVYLNVTTPPPNHKPKPTPTSQPSSSPCSSGSPLTDSIHSAETGIPQCHHTSPQPQTQTHPHITAIFIAMFEWLSPYGLHPLGRNRYYSMSPHLPPTTNPNPPPHHSHLHRHVRVALPLRTPPTRQKQVYLIVTTPPPNHKPKPTPTSQPSSSPCSSGSPLTDSTHSAETGIPQCHHTSPQPQTQTHPHIRAIFIAMFEWLSPYGLHPLGRNRYTSMSPHLPPTTNPNPPPHHSHLHRNVRVAIPLRTPPTRQKQVHLNVTTPPPNHKPKPTPTTQPSSSPCSSGSPLTDSTHSAETGIPQCHHTSPNHKPKPTPTSQPSSSPCSSGSPLTVSTHSAETGIPQCHNTSPQPQTQTHPHITAIFIAMFEWLSPYGLHPIGRNRYTSMSPQLPPTTNPNPPPHHSHLHRHVRVALPLRTPPTRQKQVYLNVTTPPPNHKPNPNPTSQPSSSPCSSGSPLTDSTHSAETGIPQCHHTYPQPQTQTHPHITAIFIAMFEWLSPYGLHPLGRNRYTSMSPHLPPTTNPNPPPHHSHLHRHVRVALPLRTLPTRQKQVYLNVTTLTPNHKPKPTPTSQPSSSPCSSGSPLTDSTHSAETGIPQCHHTSPQPQTQTHPHITAIFIAMFEWLSPYGLHPLGRNRYTSMSPHLPPTTNPNPPPQHSHLHRHVRVALPLRTPPTRQKQVYLNVTTPPPTTNPNPPPHHSHLHRHVRVALPLRSPPTRQKQVYLNVTTPPPNHKPKPTPTSQPSSSPCSSGSPLTDSTQSAETGIPQCHHNSPQPQTQTHPHITAIFIAMFEWLSPYGLHPLGRNRYTSMSPHLPPTTNPTPTPHHSHLHRHVRVALPLRTPPTRQKQVLLNVTTPPPNHKPKPTPTSQPSSSPCSSGSPLTDSTHSAETGIPQCHHTYPQPQTQTHPHITAIFIAMFEWLSPYGLHPLGRNRYTSMSPHLPPTTNPNPPPHQSHLHRHVRVALPLRTPPTRQKQVYLNVTTPPPNHKPKPTPTSQPSSSPCSSGYPLTDSTHSAETGIPQCHHTSPQPQTQTHPHITAIFIAMFEWLSPYGLPPLGRNRYTSMSPHLPQPQTQTHPHITAIFIAMFEWLSPYGLHPLGRNRYTSMSQHLPPTINPNPTPHHRHLHRHVRVALPLRTAPTRQKQVYLNVTTPPPNHKPNPTPTSQPSSSPCSSGSPLTDSTHSAETGIPQCHHTSPQPQTQTHPHITAIFIAMFEWLSPYGLHPLGRNRYTSMSPHLPQPQTQTHPHITAIFIAMFEWLSPYGLHPLGRNRYTSMSPHLPPTTNPNPPPHHSHLHRHVRVALPLRTPPTRQKQVWLNVTTPPPNHKPKPTPTSQPSSSPCSSGSPLTDSTHSAETGIPQYHHNSPQPRTQTHPHITAIFIAMFEWLSPYGLHPLGRNRYTSMSPHLPPTTKPTPTPHHSHLHRHVRVALPLRTPPTRQKQVYLNVTTPPPNHKPKPTPTSQPSSSPCSSGSPLTDSTHSAETGIPQCHHTSRQPQTQTHPHITAIFIAMFEWLSPYGLHPLGRNRYTSMSPHLPPTTNPNPPPHHSHLHRHVRVAIPLRTPPTRQKQVYLNVTTTPPNHKPKPTPTSQPSSSTCPSGSPLTDSTHSAETGIPQCHHTSPQPQTQTPTSQPSSSPCSSGSPLMDSTHSAETGIPQCHHTSPQPQTQTHPHITAIFIAMFEWLSPYGLHPLGRNRYTSMSPHLPPSTNPNPSPHHSHLHRHVRVAIPLRTPPTRQK